MPDNSIGALWKKEKNGNEYMTGNITVNEVSVKLVVFPNKYKEGVENRPDYKIYISTPKGSSQARDEDAPF